MSEHRLSIGAFARASGLSIRVLRHYHDEGLLVPAHVDPASGYRYYRPDQLVEAEVIRRLREIDLPLADVYRVVRARDAAVTQDVIAAHRETLVTRAQEALARVSRLQDLAARPLELLGDTVVERVLKAQPVLAVRAELPIAEVGQFMAEAFGHIMAMAHEDVMRFAGPGGSDYASGEGELTRVTAFAPVTAPGPRTQMLPGGRCAVIVHRGSYETIGDSYRTLGLWLGACGAPIAESMRELYLCGPGDAADPDEYVTEICWFLEEDR